MSICCLLWSGSLAAVKVIVEKTGNECIEQRDANNRTPLILATVGGHGEVVNYLLSVGGKYRAPRPATYYALSHPS